MVVKSPLSLLINHELGYQGLLDNGFTFHPKQGTPQGGNETSLGYIGFSDILLRALTLTDTSDYLTLDIYDCLHHTQPNAYVDDLNSVSATLTGLQTKADIVSAFCSIFCIELNSNKFRAFHINWGNAHGQPNLSTIRIHTDEWQPVEVALATDGSLTHLGLTRDCDLNDTIQFNELYTRTAEALHRLVSSSVSVAAKLMILKTVIFPRIRYIGKGVCWAYNRTATSYEKFDKLIFTAVRKITLNRPTFPAALIETAPDKGGLGIPRISVDCQLAKLADMRRAMSRSSHHHHTMLALVNDLFKASNQPLIGTQVRHIKPQTTDKWWLTSAADFLHSIGLTITINNKHGNANTILLKDQHPTMTATTERELYFHSIATHQELYMEGDHPSHDTQRIIDELQIEPIRRQAIPLRSDQTWLLHVNGEWQIHQLMGKQDEHTWQTVRWHHQHQPPTSGDTLTLVQGIDSLVGAGALDRLQQDDLISSTQPTALLTLSAEKYRINRSHTCKILDIRARTPWIATDQSINSAIAPRPRYQQWLADARQLGVFTDGSFRRIGTTAQRLEGHTTERCQSSIVKRSQNGLYSYLAITNDSIKHGSA